LYRLAAYINSSTKGKNVLDFVFYSGVKLIVTEYIDEKVEVGMSDSPKWIKWRNRVYKVEKVGLHHTFREGRVLYHVFSVSTKSLFMKLILDTETLGWRLTEISDGI